MTYHLAQLNVGRPVASMDDPAMADFAAGLDHLNALADGAPGFVWRLQDDDGNATALRPFGPELMVNLSVWESIETLREYVYRSAHLTILQRRREFFVHEPGEVFAVLWWVPAGHPPTVDEAWQRLELLRTQGPSPQAFSFRAPHPPPGLSR